MSSIKTFLPLVALLIAGCDAKKQAAEKAAETVIPSFDALVEDAASSDPTRPFLLPPRVVPPLEVPTAVGNPAVVDVAPQASASSTSSATPTPVPTAVLKEPALPAFKIYQDVWGVEHAPTVSVCKWVERKDEWVGIRYVPESFILPAGFIKIVPADIERCGFPFESSWTNVLNESLDRFAGEPLVYEQAFGTSEEKEITIAYGLLQAGNNKFLGGRAEENMGFRKVLKGVYNSPALLRIAYNWALPSLKAKWSSMRPKDRALYLDILRHGNVYLASFSYANELAYLRRLEAGKCEKPDTNFAWYQTRDRDDFKAGPCTHQFVDKGPDGKEDPYRKVYAFIFRRVHDGVPVATISLYLGLGIKELESMVDMQ